MATLPATVQAATAPFLGTAAGFAVLGATTVTNTGPTNVTGDLGVSPGTAVVGFPPGTLTGTIHSGVLSSAGPAQTDALAAYNEAAGQDCDTDLTGVDLGGLTLTPGVYCFDTTAQLTGTLTLDFQGDSDAIFIFQVGSALTTASSASVVTINGSPRCHQVFWQLGSSATLGSGTNFQGDILALASITANTGVVTSGSLYALTGAVTLDSNLVGTCQCVIDADCVDDGNVCTDTVCDATAPGADASGCNYPSNTAPCDDGLFCTLGDVCESGVCAGLATDCADGNVCTTDSCDEDTNACINTPNTDPCDDGLFCNGIDLCSGGVCDHPGDPCLAGGVCGNTCDESVDDCLGAAATVCRAAAGICDLPESCNGTSMDCPPDEIAPGGTPCRPDAGSCDVGEVCTGESVNCPADAFDPPLTPCTDDNNPCTDDACDATGACLHTDNSAPCNDGVACNGADACLNGVCTSTGTTESCGNGVVDAACEEQCDAPGVETCNNDLDDDGDGITDCADPDCVDPPVVSCTLQCQFAPPCTIIANDPAILYPSNMDPRAVRNGAFHFHGRMNPTTSIDLTNESFVVTISNDTGVIYRAEVAPGELRLIHKRRYVYQAPRDDSAVAFGGIDRLYVRKRKDAGQFGYGLRVRAFGDFSGATLPRMTTQVYLGDDVAFLTADWKFRSGRWTLYQKDY